MRAINGSLSFFFSQPNSLFTTALLIAAPLLINIWWCSVIFSTAFIGWCYQLIQNLAQGKHQLPSLSRPYWVLSGVLITAISWLLLPLSFVPSLIFGGLSVPQLLYDIKVLVVASEALSRYDVIIYYWETYKWPLFFMLIGSPCFWLLIAINESAVYDNEKYKPVFWLRIIQQYNGLLLKLIMAVTGVFIVYSIMAGVLEFITGTNWLFLQDLLFFAWSITNAYLLGMFACTVRLQDSMRRAHRAAL